MDAYLQCPVFFTKSFTLRLVEKADANTLFRCYNDRRAVTLMNDDNCDFGFFAESVERMQQIIDYWLDFYAKRGFIRFSILDNASGEAVGTLEGFEGQTGILRIDLASDFEKAEYVRELLEFALGHFRGLFGNEFVATKAAANAAERRAALRQCRWEYFGEYRGFPDYFRAKARVGEI